MSTEESTKTSRTLDEIESEIQQIDQLIHSWSNGRSLRFDPAHVKHKTEPPKENPAPDRNTSLLSVYFWFNLVAFLLPVGILILQSSSGFVSLQTAAFILTGGMMLFAGGNLAIAAYAKASSKRNSGEMRTNSQANRNTPSRSSC